MPLTPAERRLLRWTPAFVLGSSLAGLVRVLQVFAVVWAANLWGDLLFTIGTVAAFVGAWRIGVRTHPAVGAVAGFVLHWVVYAASFAITGVAMSEESDGFFGLRAGNPAESAALVLQVGWPGLVADAVAAGWLSHVLRRGNRPAGEPFVAS
jgi:hypothetical protein